MILLYCCHDILGAKTRLINDKKYGSVIELVWPLKANKNKRYQVMHKILFIRQLYDLKRFYDIVMFRRVDIIFYL